MIPTCDENPKVYSSGGRIAVFGARCLSRKATYAGSNVLSAKMATVSALMERFRRGAALSLEEFPQAASVLISLGVIRPTWRLHPFVSPYAATRMVPAVPVEGGDRKRYRLPLKPLLDERVAEDAAAELGLDDRWVPLVAYDLDELFSGEIGEIEFLSSRAFAPERIIGVFAPVGRERIESPVAAAHLLLTSPLVVELAGEPVLACGRGAERGEVPIIRLPNLLEKTIPIDDLTSTLVRVTPAPSWPPTNCDWILESPGEVGKMERDLFGGVRVGESRFYTTGLSFLGEPESVTHTLASCGSAAAVLSLTAHERRDLGHYIIAPARVRIAEEGVIVRGGPGASECDCGEPLTAELVRSLEGTLSPKAQHILMGIIESARRAVTLREKEDYEIWVGFDGSLEVLWGRAHATYLLPALVRHRSVATAAALADPRDPAAVGSALIEGRCVFRGDGFTLVPDKSGLDFFLTRDDDSIDAPLAMVGDADVVSDALAALSTGSHSRYVESPAAALAIRDAAAVAGGETAELDIGRGLTTAAVWSGDSGGVAARLSVFESYSPEVVLAFTAAASSPDIWFLAGTAASPLTFDAPAWLIPVLGLATAWSEDGMSELVWLPAKLSRAIPFASSEDISRYISAVGARDVDGHSGAPPALVRRRSAGDVAGFFEAAAAHGAVATDEGGAMAKLGETILMMLRSLLTVVPDAERLVEVAELLGSQVPESYVALAGLI